MAVDKETLPTAPPSIVSAVEPELQFLWYKGPWPATLGAFRHRNFRLFWFGQLISLIGTWMQSVAQGWLITELVLQHYKTANASAYLGVIGALGSAPMLLFSLFAGAIADQRDKRRILIATQTSLMLLAFALGLLVGTPLIRLWHIAVLAVLTGFVMAFDMPTRQAFVKDMVGREDLLNAIALNSSVFNSARIIGPAVAGWLIAFVSMRSVFLINAASYLAVIAGLILIRHKHIRPSSAGRNIFHHLREGFQFVAHHRTIRLLMMIMGVYSIFGFSYFVLMPVFARQVLGLQAKGYGVLISSTGIGPLAGAVLLAAMARRVRKGHALLAGGITFSVGLMVFSQTRHFGLAVALLPFVGGGLVVSSATINSLIQELSPDRLRGRVISIWTFIFAGFMPIGYLYSGWLAQQTSPSLAIFLGGLACFLLVVFLSFRAPWVWREL